MPCRVEMGGIDMRKAIAAVLAPVVLIAGPLAPARAVPPIEVYGQDPDLDDVQISADGTKLAMSRTQDGRPGLFILDLGTRQAVRYDLGELKIRNVEWSSATHVLLYVSKTTNIIEYRSPQVEFCGVFAINTAGDPEPKQLLGRTKTLALQSSLCDVESRLWTDDGAVLMSARKDTGGAITGEEALFRVDGNTGRGSVVADGTDSTRDWVTSPKGHVVARVDHLDKSNRYRVLVPTDADRLGGWKTVFSEETEVPTLTVYGATAAEDALVIGTRLKSDRYALFVLSLVDGAIGKPVFEPDGVDISSVIVDPYTGAVVGANYVRDRSEQIFFQNDLQMVLGAAQKALKDWESVRVVSWDRARHKFVIFAAGSASAGDYFILDRRQGKLEHVSAWRPDIKRQHIAPVRAFSYTARDGLVIPAYLTLPPGTPPDAKNLPLVVHPHGGPASRDSVRFDYWAQAMASRGYAVLQMNFRGSDGYGTDFEALGNGEWGGKMQDDITDGVRAMIAQGIADPARICIVGGSYGGYAALAGAAFTPELYTCAVAVAPVSDLPRFLNWQRNRYGADSAIYEYWIGTIGDDPARNAARSPARAAAAVTADVLLIHGKDDTVVAFDQSQVMHDALKAAGKSVRLIRLDGEDHWLSTAATRIQMLKALEAFLAKHLG